MNLGDTGGTVHRAAPAKLNLFLHVVGKRADGYHLLDSLVAFADVHDTVSASASKTLSLAVAGPFANALAGEGDNLVLRAARKLAEAGGVAPGLSLQLIKRLPVASGIGGGSADAAATLLAAAEILRVRLSPEALQAIALSLGADVPVCLAGRATQMSGIGEIVSPAPVLPEAPIVLVNPLIPLPTPSVFKARQGAFSKPAPLGGEPRDARDLAEALVARRNDLEGAAINLVPAIAKIRAALAVQPGCLLARMSGSGATCFALFASAGEATAAESSLRRARPGWWVKASRLVNEASALRPSLDPA